MSARPRLSKLRLWAAREKECLDLLAQALARLAGDPGPDADEDNINRRLMRFLDASGAQGGMGARNTLGPVVYEGRSSPAPSDPTRASREFKRPDFAWLWFDDLVADPMLSRREFVVECKRLGVDPFPRRYVTDGILRFVKDSHAYGKDMRSGAMVGYLQSIPIDTAVKQVNANVTSRNVSTLKLRSKRGDDEAKLEHRVTREFDVSPFLLTHLWVRLT
jgi:hypothetical protein